MLWLLMVFIARDVESTALGAVGCCHQQLLWPCHGTGQVFHARQVDQFIVLPPYNRADRLYFLDIVFADAVAILTANATAMSCSCSCCFCLCCCCGCVGVYTFFSGGASMPAAQKPGSQHSSKSAAGSGGGALVLSARLWQPRPSSSKADHLFIISKQLFEMHVEVSTWLPVRSVEFNL